MSDTFCFLLCTKFEENNRKSIPGVRPQQEARDGVAATVGREDDQAPFDLSIQPVVGHFCVAGLLPTAKCDIPHSVASLAVLHYMTSGQVSYHKARVTTTKTNSVRSSVFRRRGAPSASAFLLDHATIVRSAMRKRSFLFLLGQSSRRLAMLLNQFVGYVRRAAPPSAVIEVLLSRKHL
jgi:hypothetical protein